MKTIIENKTPQKQIQPKIEKPYIGSPSKGKVICTLERDLPEDCNIVADIMTIEAYRDVYGYCDAFDLLCELKAICERLIDDNNTTPQDKLHYAKILVATEKWKLNNNQLKIDDETKRTN